MDGSPLNYTVLWANARAWPDLNTSCFVLQHYRRRRAHSWPGIHNRKDRSDARAVSFTKALADLGNPCREYQVTPSNPDHAHGPASYFCCNRKRRNAAVMIDAAIEHLSAGKRRAAG